LDRMAHDMSIELKNRGARVSVVSLWPGPVRTEYILENTKTSVNKSLRLAAIFGRETCKFVVVIRGAFS
uniref:Universal stress protein n=1 Tax=Echinostoma caproni TaxID=27848 RepID=A0A183A2Y0_9TREM